jgi:branched-subunit amino acid transport protein
VEVEDASLLLFGKLFLWTLDVSAATVEYTVVSLSKGVDEKIGSLISPIVFDDFFVKSDISVTISSPIVDCVMEGISSVLFNSFIFEDVIADEMVSVTTIDSDIFGVSATNVVLNGAEFVELFELLNVSVVALSAICVEVVISKDVSFGRSVVEIKLIVGDETILFSRARSSTSSVIVGVSVDSLVDLVWLDDWRSFEIDGSVEMLPPIETEGLVDIELKLKGTVKFRVIFSVLEIMEVEDASLLVVGKLFLWTFDVSTATVVTLSRGVDENIGSLINPVLLDDFFVKTDISVTISSPVVDGVMEGISSVLFTSFISEAVIEDEMVSADSYIFGVSATNVVLNGAEFVEFFELLNVSVVVLSAICVELVISKDVSFGRSVVELYSVEIKLIVGDETILFSAEVLSCVVDEIVDDDEVKMMGAVKFSGLEVEDVLLLIVETLYSLMVEARGSTSSVMVGVSMDSLVDLVPLGDWRSFETDGSVEVLPPIETEASDDVELKLIGMVKFRVIFSILEIMEV